MKLTDLDAITRLAGDLQFVRAQAKQLAAGEPLELSFRNSRDDIALTEAHLAEVRAAAARALALEIEGLEEDLRALGVEL